MICDICGQQHETVTSWIAQPPADEQMKADGHFYVPRLIDADNACLAAMMNWGWTLLAVERE